jgi:glycosyltransferase involved in cell wall biosynthesis
LTQRPRVVLDLRMVEGRMHGIARYALALAARLPALLPEVELVGLGPPRGLPALGPLAPPFPVRPCAARFLSPFEQPALALALLQARASLFHATSFSVPRLWPGRLVATLHDATHLVRPAEYGRLTALYYRLVVQPRLRSAEAVLTVSAFSKEELVRTLALAPSRMEIVPPGVDARFRPPASAELEAARTALGLPAHYLLAVGNSKPHKNLRRLVTAAPQLPAPLVLLAGPDARRLLALPPELLALPEVEEALLPALYGGADALLLPSLHEGFGLPALEAMASGCPVVAARAGALPEVVDGAGLLVAPDDTPAWVEATQRLAGDGALRASLVAQGLARAKDFSWEVCARRTADVYRRALATQARG